MPGCTTRLDIAAIRLLADISHAVLPDPRATHGFQEQGGAYKEEAIAPLSREEFDRLERFLQVAAIPPERKGQCPNIPACGRVLDVPPSNRPASHACPYCEKRVCRACKFADHAGMSCEAAKRAQKTDKQSQGLIEATTKACPHCGFRARRDSDSAEDFFLDD